ncbi:rod shape-determining protein [Mycoplasmatota bacterium]|nr:rod shape-determining protein [Mycoplasmatota bacterium]
MIDNKIGIGIDLGTTNLLVYVQGHGIIFNEPSVVAFDIETGEVIAGGEDACSMIGKTHQKIRVSRPLREGVISDMDAAKALLRYVFKRIQNVKNLQSAKCLICCPSEVTQIEREAMRELAIQMGITDVFIEEEVKSGAIGSGIDIYTANASMVIDIGGGTTDVGVLSLGDVVLSQSIRIAGNYIDQQIIKYVHKTHNLVIGQKTAERAKIEIATLLDNDEKFTRVSGRDLVTGLPSATKISSKEMRKLLLPIFDEIVNVVYSVLEQTPPELSADIVDNGIIINGGGALIPGVKEYVEEMVNLPVKISDTPLIDVVEGTKVLLKNRGSYLINPTD